MRSENDVPEAVVVYESMFGNCRRVAHEVAEGLGRHARVTVVDVADAATRPELLDGADLLVAGGPTHAFSMSRPGSRAEAVQRASEPVAARTVGLREWSGALPDAGTPRLAATFDTRASRIRSVPGSAARSAAKVLTRKGYELVVPSRSFFVEEYQGPVAPGELDAARTWGDVLGAALLSATTSLRSA
ncbi:flavodoxin family protein [Oerskovia flava]|uniref:flavodoxin family protein n=1 Tax=Oerskovia flava TaxID=2986422 RepID=UPI002240C8D3|nr:flavodoxin family protein [Oerskovia sp. JB1-3-2]